MKRLPTPTNWVSGLSLLAKFGLLVGVGGAVYSAAQTVVALLRGSLLGALTAGGLTIFFGASIAAVACTLLVSARADAGWNGSGTTVRVHPSIAWCYGVALFGGAVGSACYLAIVLRGGTDLPFAVAGRGGATRYLMAALLAVSVIGLIALLRTRESGHLRVGPDGIEHADMFRTRSARWEDVVEVTDKADKRARNPIVFVVKGAKPIVVPNADRYGSSGGASYWMARHYRQHSADRDELADGRALERLRNEQFDPC
jgi:hypothetical protein